MGLPVLQSELKNNLIPSEIIIEFKKDVLVHFEKLKYPLSSDESWRKFPLHQFDFAELKNQNPTQSLVPNSNFKTSNHEPLELKGIKLKLETLLGIVRENYFALYTLLHAENYYFYTLQSISESNPLNEFEWALDQKSNGFNVFLVSVPEGVQGKIKETYHSKIEGDSIHLFGNLSHYFLEDNAHLDVLIEEEYDENLYNFRFVSSTQSRDSNLNIYSFPIRGFRSKTFYTPYLDGKGSNFLLTGVSSLSGRSILDIDAKVTHLGDNTQSKISYKSIVSGRSHHIFTGNLFIPSSVKKVSAHQESHNLSLSKKARAEANPKLEVLAEDVSCTHGATVGDIDEEQLFYLLTRGLTLDESKSLLVSAFFKEIVEAIPFAIEIKENISDKIGKSLLGN
ncbi:MAG: SufD family Fe-S cluster assembly protein [Leptospira sp.]|nr:SufD family Fe-S cluster assembly protein [Leptospira sp.]